MGVVAWSADDFLGVYPQFSGLTSAQLEHLWETATGLVGNTDNAPLPYDPDNGVFVRKIVLYAVVCHLATMQGWGQQGQSGAVSSASEGSVSASFQVPAARGGNIGNWYNQTLCGRTAWAFLRKLSLGGRYYGVRHFHPYG